MKYTNLIWLFCFLLQACGEEEKKPTPLERDASNTFGAFSDNIAAYVNRTPGKLAVDFSHITLALPVKQGIMQHPFIIKNTGGGNVVIKEVAVASFKSHYRVTLSCEDTLLESGETCEVHLSYLSDQIGRHHTSVIVSYRGEESPLVIPVIAHTFAEESPTVEKNPQDPLLEQHRKVPFEGGLAEHDATYRYPTTVKEGSERLDRSRIIRAGSVIPIVLEDTILSEDSGQVTARVDRPVYARGVQSVIIPQGTQVIGRYAGGDKGRLEIVWHRMDTPGEQVVYFEGVASDQMGRAGVGGVVDKRLWDRFGIPALITLIGGGSIFLLDEESTTVSDGGGVTTVESPESKMVTHVIEGFETITSQLLNDNADIREVVTVPAGTLMLIKVQEDIFIPESSTAYAFHPRRGKPDDKTPSEPSTYSSLELNRRYGDRR